MEDLRMAQTAVSICPLMWALELIIAAIIQKKWKYILSIRGIWHSQTEPTELNHTYYYVGSKCRIIEVRWKEIRMDVMVVSRSIYICEQGSKHQTKAWCSNHRITLLLIHDSPQGEVKYHLALVITLKRNDFGV